MKSFLTKKDIAGLCSFCKLQKNQSNIEDTAYNYMVTLYSKRQENCQEANHITKGCTYTWRRRHHVLASA